MNEAENVDARVRDILKAVVGNDWYDVLPKGGELEISKIENSLLSYSEALRRERDELKFAPGATKVGVMAIITNQKGQILLGKKGRAVSAEFVGKWVAPGGRINYGETLEHAVVRECEEECGIIVSIQDRLPAQQVVGEKFHFVFPTFICVVDEGDVAIAGDDLAEVKWFSEEELHGIEMTPITLNAIQDFRQWNDVNILKRELAESEKAHDARLDELLAVEKALNGESSDALCSLAQRVREVKEDGDKATAAHDEIGSICFMAGAQTADWTSVSAVVSLVKKLTETQATLLSLAEKVWESRWVSEDPDYQSCVGTAAEIRSGNLQGGKELLKDKARLDFYEMMKRKNNLYAISFEPMTPGYHENVRKNFPNGFFRWLFGFKDDPNRYHTLREALDAGISEQSKSGVVADAVPPQATERPEPPKGGTPNLSQEIATTVKRGSLSISKNYGGWTQVPPKVTGWFWHWNGDPDCGPNPFSVMRSTTAHKAFVARGQYGITKEIDCDVFGGWWLPLVNPLTPAELD